MTNRVIIVYERPISPVDLGPPFGRRNIIPNVFDVDDAAAQFSAGNQLLSIDQAQPQFLSGYFAMRLKMDEFNAYHQRRFRPPELSPELLQSIPPQARAEYNARTLHNLPNQSGSILLIWKSIERDSVIP